MQVLIIKLSSMGDLVHAFQGIAEAKTHVPKLQLTWVVESPFADILRLQESIDKIIISDLRVWKKNKFRALWSGHISAFICQLRQVKYDLIIDAQGLIKSAILAKLARGPSIGFDKNSARESLASYFYQKKYYIDKNQHASLRLRQLFSKTFKYPINLKFNQFGINSSYIRTFNHSKPYCVFIVPTTWINKHYPVIFWQVLVKEIGAKGFEILFPAKGTKNLNLVQILINELPYCHVLPAMNLLEMAGVLHQANSVIGVDTGLTHLSAALGVKTIGLFGPSSAFLSGSLGPCAINLSVEYECSPCLSRKCKKVYYNETPPCYQSLNPERVLKAWTNTQSKI